MTILTCGTDGELLITYTRNSTLSVLLATQVVKQQIAKVDRNYSIADLRVTFETDPTPVQKRAKTWATCFGVVYLISSECNQFSKASIKKRQNIYQTMSAY